MIRFKEYMESIVFFGKGGIGKSTIAANISVLFAAKGRKVLHVGCDPKRDSTLSLMGRRIRPFNEQGGSTGEEALRLSLHRTIKGIDCIEAGGPQAGVGCAGAGIGAMLDAIKDSSLIEKEGYDTVVFDVLGDVVCGGFAAPLRRGFASKAVLVVSEELLSLYAANNLISMVNNYARNGVFLAGLVVNAKDPAAVKLARDFAKAANTRVLGVIPRDPAVIRSERARKPVVALEPRSEAARSLARLAGELAAAGMPASPPRMLGEAEFEAFMNERPLPRAARSAAPAPARENRKARVAASVLLERSGFSMTGVTGGQVVCAWKGGGDTFRLFIAPASDSRPAMVGVGDWAYCFLPGEGPGSNSSRDAFLAALGEISGLRFDDFISAFSGGLDFYGNVDSFGKTSSHPLMPEGGRPVEPYLGFGQWQRFLFSDSSGICIPPGSVMVEHGDNECRFSGCSQTPLNTFQKIAGLANDSTPSLGPLLPKEERLIVTTDFLYQDAVNGDEKKIAAALKAAAARTGPGGLVEFYTGCAPLVLASDVSSFSDRAARDLGVEVLRENFNSFCTETPEKVRARSAFVVRRLSALKRAKKPLDVNLINFGGCREPLSALLGSKGLALKTWEEEFYSDIASARLQVLSAADPVLTAAFDQLGIKWAAPGAPYGAAATGAWLRSLFSALGRKSPKEGFGPARKETEAVAAGVKRLSRFAAGFVASPEEIGMLEGSWAVSGVPLVSFLAEAGLALRLFVYAADRAARTLAGAETAALAARTGTKPRLAFFDSPGGLLKALSGDRALRLVYSDIPLDPRLAAAGKSAFSVSACEPGYEGAAETLRRLAQLCEWDFNERYFRTKSV
ncbi:MAG: AAA family ATPase [Elusimicrobia bacterium]|nr:AAA family ATPase [Elusimicrobiota bacterium]